MKPRFMILDACVLIDFIKADSSVFELFAKYIGPLHVVSSVAEEVRDVDTVSDLILGFFLILALNRGIL